MQKTRKIIFEKCLEEVTEAESNSAALYIFKNAVETYTKQSIEFNEKVRNVIEEIIYTTSVFADLEENKYALEYYSDITTNLVIKREKERKSFMEFQKDLKVFLERKKFNKLEITKVCIKYI